MQMPINMLPEETSPSAGDWMLIETPTESRKLDAGWLTSATGAGAGLAAHVAAVANAHAAAAITATPGTNLTGTNVQAQLAEIDMLLAMMRTALARLGEPIVRP